MVGQDYVTVWDCGYMQVKTVIFHSFSNLNLLKLSKIPCKITQFGLQQEQNSTFKLNDKKKPDFAHDIHLKICPDFYLDSVQMQITTLLKIPEYKTTPVLKWS